MICTNCGTNNDPNNKFCLKCGAKLNNEGNAGGNNPVLTINNSGPEVNNFTNNESTISKVPSENMGNQVIGGTNAKSSFNYFKCLLFSVIKPIDTLKEEDENLSDIKNSGIICLLISLVMMVVNLIKTMISTGYVPAKTSIFGETTKATFDFDLIKELNFVDLILKDFFIILGIILGITVVFYLGSLVIKKNLNFAKTLAIASISAIPVALGYLILGPVLGLIWADLNVIFIAIGIAYSLTLLYTLVDSELSLSGNIKVYYFAVCFAIFLIIGYYILRQMIVSSITDSLGDIGNILDMFS